MKESVNSDEIDSASRRQSVPLWWLDLPMETSHYTGMVSVGNLWHRKLADATPSLAC